MMRVITSAVQMQNTALELRHGGEAIGFVPTMGFLHEGHLSLMRLAKAKCDVLLVSIFVNPVQFESNGDLGLYPRDLERDKNLCANEGVDIMFCPTTEEMYPRDYSVYVEESELSQSLCGPSRPGHFRGVTTVVTKLFNIVQPNIAVFGQKDAQQARVIQRMVRDLNFPVQILIAPIVREADGLALSSRNTNLSTEERKNALCLSQSLQLASRMYEQGLRETDGMKKKMRQLIERTPLAEFDYVEIVDYERLKPIARIDGTALAAVAVKLGNTRLIDNILICPTGAAQPAL